MSDACIEQGWEGPGGFGSTPWSVVLAAGDSRHANNRHSLEVLCTSYWPPLYAYIRRKIRDQHLAQDLIQSFFERLLSGRSLRLADPARGRFRTFLIQAFEWHLANVFRDGNTVKRGGAVQIFPLDFSSGSPEPLDDGSLTPEQLFDRDWALTLLNETMNKLEQEQVLAENDVQFRRLKVFLTGEGSPGDESRGEGSREGYAAVCGSLGMTESAARMAVSRLRNRYRELLRAEILRTVASSQDVDDEIHHLFRALSAGGS